MDNNQITPEWIAQQRQISEIVNMTYEDAPGSVVPLLKQLEKSQTAAIDALEAAYAEIAILKAEVRSAKDVTQTASDEASEGCNTITQLQAEKWELQEELSRLTAERDAAVKIIRDARVYLDELGSPQYCLYQLMKWPCDENGGEEDGNKN